MKKLYVLFVFIGLFSVATAQNVVFENYTFKQLLLDTDSSTDVAMTIGGSRMTVDANNDNEIQLSEALLVGRINVPSNRISSLVGIRSFANLMVLNCSDNELVSLDLTGMSNLYDLNCGYNWLTSINLTGVNALKQFNCQNNSLTLLDLSGKTLRNLKCQYNQLTGLNVDFEPNQSPYDQWGLYCNNNLLTSLNFTGDFAQLNCDSNQLTQINVSAQTESLKKLTCRSNRISSLNITGMYRLEELSCSNNLLTELNFIPTSALSFSNLRLLSFDNNSIGNIDTSHFSALQVINATNTNISVLDVNLSSSLLTLYANNCPQLKALMIKKQYFPSVLEFQNCPSLNFVCVKDADIPTVQQKINTYGYTNCTINSYCNFNPAGTFYLLEGNNKFSLSGDCAGSGNPLSFMRFNITGGSSARTVIADNTGAYRIPFQSGTYSVMPIIGGNPNRFTITPSPLNVTFPNAANPYIQNFCVSPNYSYQQNDVETMIYPVLPAVPGFNAKYKVVYRNNGNSVQSGTVSFAFNDDVFDLVAVSTAVTNQTTGNLSWNFTNLQPLEMREIEVVLNLNSSVETPPVNIGDVLYSNASVTGSLQDNNTADNSFDYVQTVVGSYDPNDKTCLQGAIIAPSEVGKYVHYMIRFENTGTANAQNIVVKDMIDLSKFDINSLEPIKGSHSFYTNITSGNKVEFIFENINLPFDDANNDGYLLFKIKTRTNLVAGNTFSNNASIYFDYNAPIVTNTATTIIQVLSAQDFVFGQYFSIYPNPVKDVLHIETKQTIEVSSVCIYNTLGQLVLVVPNAQNVKTVDVSSLSSGNYFIKIDSDKGASNAKFIKQ